MWLKRPAGLSGNTVPGPIMHLELQLKKNGRTNPFKVWSVHGPAFACFNLASHATCFLRQLFLVSGRA